MHDLWKETAAVVEISVCTESDCIQTQSKQTKEASHCRACPCLACRLSPPHTETVGLQLLLHLYIPLWQPVLAATTQVCWQLYLPSAGSCTLPLPLFVTTFWSSFGFWNIVKHNPHTMWHGRNVVKQVCNNLYIPVATEEMLSNRSVTVSIYLLRLRKCQIEV